MKIKKFLTKLFIFISLLSIPIKTMSGQMTPQQKTEVKRIIYEQEQQRKELEAYNLKMAETFKSIHSEYVMTEDELEQQRIAALPYVEVPCELTFYTDMAICNGQNAGKNAIGGVLSQTSIAVPSIDGKPIIPYGTRIDIGSQYGMRIADDTGNEKYIRVKKDGTIIFDVFIPRLKGENDRDYKARIMNMGRIKTTAKIYKERSK